MMADYQYVGLTAYIKENEDTSKKLKVFRDILMGINPEIDEMEANPEIFGETLNDESFVRLSDGDKFCFPGEWELPENTPKAYQEIQVESTVIKGLPMVRVYVPMVSKNRNNELDEFVDKALVKGLLELFEGELVSMATKTAMEYEDFQDAQEKIRLSVNDTLKTTA